MEINDNLMRFLRYMEFKAKCAGYQVENPVRLDYDKAVEHVAELEELQEEKVQQLVEVMPKIKVYKTRKKPKITHKKDGTLSSYGDEWFRLLREKKLPVTHTDDIEVFSHFKEPNPNSVSQVKDWLFSLGWKPTTFKFSRDANGNEKQIAQVRKDSELCPSVIKLKAKAPELEHLEGLTVIQHRLGIFKGFVSCAIEKDGKHYLRAEFGGLTNTLRFKHKKPLVNLPGVDKPWGKEIRSCLIAEEGEVYCGADMVSLEDTTKRHYIKPYDPEYVEEMSQDGFDPHLDLALREGFATREQYDNYTGGNKTEEVEGIRKFFKPVNYSAVYGIKAKALSRDMGISVKEAQELLDSYWARNWAVEKVAEKTEVLEFGNYCWARNPLSGFLHELRYPKDKWSTVNQSTGVYVFDSWLARCAALGYWGQSQFHDETGSSVTSESQTREVMLQAIENLNRDLKCNVDFGIDMSFGRNYAEVH